MSEHPMITAAKDAFFAAELNGTAVDKSVTATLQWLADPANLSDGVVEAAAATLSDSTSPYTDAKSVITAMIKELIKEIER